MLFNAVDAESVFGVLREDLLHQIFKRGGDFKSKLGLFERAIGRLLVLYLLEQIRDNVRLERAKLVDHVVQGDTARPDI